MKHFLTVLSFLGTAAIAMGQLEGEILAFQDFPGLNEVPQPVGVSADGRTVIGDMYSDAGGLPSFQWTRSGGFAFLSQAGRMQVRDISDDGTIIVGQLNDQPVRWIHGVAQSLGPLPDGFVQGSAAAISRDNSTIVGALSGTRMSRPFIWRNGVFQMLGILSGSDNYCSATAVSSDGSVVVGTSGYSSTQAFRWTNLTGMVGLGFPTGFANCSVTGMSDDGQVVLVRSFSPTTNQRGYTWTANDGFTALPLLAGANHSYPSATNDDGSLIVGSSGVAVLWIDGVVQRMDTYLSGRGVPMDSQWNLTSPWDFTPDGTMFVGTGMFDGRYAGFVAQALPEGIVEANGFSVDGFVLAGGLADLHRWNASKLQILCDTDTGRALLDVISTSPISAPNHLAFELRAWVGRPGLVMSTRLRNYATGAYDLLDGRLAPTADNLITITPANPLNYLSAARQMRTRVSWEFLNDEDPSVDGWVVSIDVARWNVR